MDKIEEIREILSEKPVTLSKKVKIIFDGRQYNIRIPKSFAEKLGKRLDEFEFTLEISKKKKLYGEVVYDPKL
jgi:hypothetical protein